jgi:uncharacterized protein (TIGR02265 family)
MIQLNAAVKPSVPSFGELTDYELRLPHAGPNDTVRGLFFNGVFNALKALGGEQAMRHCHQLLDDPRYLRRFIDFTNYPVTDFLRLAAAATRVLAPQVGGSPEAQRQIGMQSVNDFFGSMAGKTLLLLSGNSPQRALGNLPAGYNTSVSYGDRKVMILSDTSARVSYQADLMPPAHNEGALLGILKGVQARNPRVRSSPRGLLDCDYELSWE